MINRSLFLKPILFFSLVSFQLGFFSLKSYCQTNDQTSNYIISKLKMFMSNHVPEKVYLQFDKPYYCAGDTIYFKAYVTAGEKHELSDLSGVLHVDLIDIRNKLDRSIKLQLIDGVAWGDFALPDTIPQGNYRVRAYTRWMCNDGEKNFFDKIIPLVSLKDKRIPESIAKKKHTTVGMEPNTQFLPEGGSLVTGIRSRVAFKATDTNGYGIDLKGTIIDNENREVVSFSSSHLGMGDFYLIPAEGETYKAKITYPNGTRKMIDLPKSELSGITLSVNNDSLSNAQVKIEANPIYYRQNMHKVYTLIVYSQGIATTIRNRLDSPVTKLIILKRKLHTGVATVTLFSPQNEPLCERLFFVQNYDQLSLNIKFDKTTYHKRERVKFKLNAVNRKGDPATGHFSVSVIDESKVLENENEDNILSYLLLTSDLKGYIEQPGYYFADTSSSVSRNLDLLLLTQGYRKFEWKQILESTDKLLAYQPEKGVTISGQVRNERNEPIGNGTINLIPRTGGPFLTSTFDDKGMFYFSNLVFTDTVYFFLSSVNAKRKNSTKITYFDRQDIPSIKPAEQLMSTVPDTAMTLLLDNAKIQQQETIKHAITNGILLKQVDIKGKKTRALRSQSYVAEYAADQVIQGKDIPYGGLLSVRLMSLLRGVNFLGGQPVADVNTDGPMEVLIDGVPGNIDDVSTDGVEMIEVLKIPTSNIYGRDGRNGVIVITTRPRTMREGDITSIGVLPIAAIGFYKAREFYSPKYNHANGVTEKRDLRTTIYWKPELQTDKDGNASLNYYNADSTATYKLVLEGIDNNGNIGRLVYKYKVE